MQPNKSATGNPIPSGSAKLTSTARKAWVVDFVVPAPQSMPSERLKARAELVRNALSSGTY